MKMIVGHVWTYIDGAWPRGILDRVTSYEVEGKWFVSSYKKGHWDGRERFIKYDQSRKQHFFPTGLLNRVTSALDMSGYPYQLWDERSYEIPEPVLALHPNIKLDVGKYSYQGAGVQTALGIGRGILKVATGGGKTEMAAAIIASLNRPTLWLTHLLTLLEQTASRLEERLQEKVGRISGEVFDPKRITVATIQTFARNTSRKADIEKLARSVEVVIGDEIHHLEAAEWYEVFSKIQAPWRFGLSATPCITGPGMALVGMTGEVIYEVTPTQLMDIGVLAKPRIWFVSVDQPKLPKKTDFHSVYRQGIVNNEFRNEMVRRVAASFKEEGKPTLILVKMIEHGEILENLLNRCGIRAEFLSGKDWESTRQDSIRRLSEGRIQAIIATRIFNEGKDIPCVRAVINATGSKGGGNAKEGDSGRVTIQVLGRGTRTSDGKDSFDYVDFSDKTHKFLMQASLARVETLELEGYAQFIKPWARYGLDI